MRTALILIMFAPYESWIILPDFSMSTFRHLDAFQKSPNHGTRKGAAVSYAPAQIAV